MTNLRMGNSLPYPLFTRNLIGLFSNPLLVLLRLHLAAAQSFTSSSWEGERVGITLRQVNTSGLWLQRYLKYNLII